MEHEPADPASGSSSSSPESSSPDRSAQDFVGSQVKHIASVTISLSAIAFISAIALTRFDLLPSASVAYGVALTGTVGGTANNYRKLQRLRDLSELDVTESSRALATAQIYLSPVIGAVFALLLYGLFLSGVLQGDFFPAFGDCSDEKFHNYKDFADCNPDTNADVAMAMVWGFVAGFAERFVPNVLDRLIAENEPDAGE